MLLLETSLSIHYSIFGLTCLPAAIKTIDFTIFSRVFLYQRGFFNMMQVMKTLTKEQDVHMQKLSAQKPMHYESGLYQSSEAAHVGRTSGKSERHTAPGGKQKSSSRDGTN